MTNDSTTAPPITELDRIFEEAGLSERGAHPAKRSNKRGEQTRDKIIEAAIDCFTEYGYTRTRISDITHRAETAQGNFYRHFGSLDEVFLEALRPGLDDLNRSLRGRSRGEGDLQTLTEVNTAFLHAYARHRHTLRLLREAAAASPNEGFQALWLRIRGDFVARTRRWLYRLRDNGILTDESDLDLLAESLGCLTEQMAYIHVGLPPAAPRREQLDELGRAIAEVWHRSLPRPVHD